MRVSRPAEAGSGGTRALTQAILDAQRGDEGAFRMVYRAMQPRLVRYLRALVGDDADDVASETWVHIVRDLGSFSGDWDNFRGWAATIGRHRAMDHLRSARRRPSVSTAMDQMFELLHNHGAARGRTAPDASVQAEEALATDVALTLIASLPPDQAEAVLLRAVVGLDARTAGQVLGKRAGAVRMAAYRGLRRLAEMLGPDGVAGLATDHGPAAGHGVIGGAGIAPGTGPVPVARTDRPGSQRSQAVTAAGLPALKRVR